MKSYDRPVRSPYARYEKKPYRYSDAYYRWAKSVQDHGLMHEETLAADTAFRRKWGVVNNKEF